MCKHQQRFGLDVQCSALVLNFNNIFSNGHLYRAGQPMNSLPSQILERYRQAESRTNTPMTPRLITILILIIGLGLFSYSLTLSYYKDQILADNLIGDSYNMDKADYYKKEAELRTNKTTFMDLGSGLAIASATILVFLFFTKVKTFEDFKNNTTLTKTATLISANLVWLILIPGTYWYYIFRAGRGDYPPFADSIGIPLMTQIPFYLFLLIPLNIFIFLTTIKTNLPTKLFPKPNKYNRTTILWEIFFGFWLLVNLICLIGFVADGDHFSIPVNLFFTFILLTLRAGQISKYEQTENDACL